ncbi:MAG TPA: hypothetical protein PLP49_12190 [Anaerohalosphaeraceae bacterium]|nr:hypothetical protein [Anaerohalosphaeraceae bacterium]
MEPIHIDIEKGTHEYLQRQKKNLPLYVNRISALDDPCLRRLYYMRAAWDKAAETSDYIQGIFETGKKLESVILQMVAEIGPLSDPPWRIIGTSMPTRDNLLEDYQIRGTVDGFLQIQKDGEWETVGVIDIKTMDPHVWQQVKTYEDLDRYSWTRKYRGQLMLYSLAYNFERCFLLAVNKNNLSQTSLIQFPVDMEYCDRLLAKASNVNEHVARGVPPEGINDPDECPKCRFFSYCCPTFSTGGNLEICDDEELESILNRIEELEPAAEEYDELKKQLDAKLVKGKDIICGKWMVLWKPIEKHFKPQPAKDGFTRTEWRKSILNTEQKKEKVEVLD